MSTRNPSCSAGLVLSAFMLFSPPLTASNQQEPSVTRDRGLNTVSFDTLHGRVVVNLPDDVQAGDTISGAVFAEPRGDSEEERARNRDELNGYVLEINEQAAPAAQGLGKWIIPLGATAFPLILRDSGGEQVASADLPIHPLPTLLFPEHSVTVANHFLPKTGQASRPTEIWGLFDGDFDTTTARIGHSDAKVLAESPRKVVVRSPADVVGVTRIVLREGDSVSVGEYRSVAVTLHAPKTTLQTGEDTTLTIKVEGLENLREPLDLLLENRTPGVVELEGGTPQPLSIQPDAVQAPGAATLVRSLTGVGPGGFSLSVRTKAPHEDEVKACEQQFYRVGTGAAPAPPTCATAAASVLAQARSTACSAARTVASGKAAAACAASAWPTLVVKEGPECNLTSCIGATMYAGAWIEFKCTK